MDYNHDANDRRRKPLLGNYYCMVHVIRQGDTLYRLSRQYGVKVSALMMANPFVDVYNLRIGDELCIPRLGRPEEMPMQPMSNDMPMRPMPGDMPMRPMPGDMPMRPMPENMPMQPTPGDMQTRPTPNRPMRAMNEDEMMEDCDGINCKEVDDTY